jgi:hypothetical protein
LGKKNPPLKKRLLLAACTVVGLALVGVGVAQQFIPQKLPVAAQVWPEPSEEEIEAAQGNRYYSL